MVAQSSSVNGSKKKGTIPQSNDGVDATSPLLWDGQVLHTPGEYSEDNAGTNLYSEPDVLGSSAGVLSSADGTDATYEYDAFGNVMGGSGSLPVSYPFDQGFGAGVGYTEEAGTGGLVRCGNRYYNPYFGRFLTQDPSGDGMNWYAYSNNNPTTSLDPTGLLPAGSSVITYPGTDQPTPVQLLTYSIGWLVGHGMPGTTYNIYEGTGTSGPLLGTYTVPGRISSSSSWAAQWAVTDDFFHGRGPINRYYNSHTAQSRALAHSWEFQQILHDISRGAKNGSIGHLSAFGYSMADLSNGVQAQVGGYTWKLTNPNNVNAGLDVYNDVSLGSLLADQYRFNRDNNDGTDFETIHQKIHVDL